MIVSSDARTKQYATYRCSVPLSDARIQKYVITIKINSVSAIKEKAE